MAAMVLIISTASHASGDGSRRGHHQSAVISTCYQAPSEHVVKERRPTTPAVKVTMQDSDGKIWNAYIDRANSRFDWKPGTFLYPNAWHADGKGKIDQGVLFDIEAKCEELAGVPCLTTDVSKIDANPTYRENP